MNQEPKPKLFLTVRQAYGKEFVYPDCVDSVTLCEMLKQNTLTPKDLIYLERLGFEIEKRNAEPDVTDETN